MTGITHLSPHLGWQASPSAGGQCVSHLAHPHGVDKSRRQVASLSSSRRLEEALRPNACLIGRALGAPSKPRDDPQPSSKLPCGRPCWWRADKLLRSAADRTWSEHSVDASVDIAKAWIYRLRMPGQISFITPSAQMALKSKLCVFGNDQSARRKSDFA